MAAEKVTRFDGSYKCKSYNEKWSESNVFWAVYSGGEHLWHYDNKITLSLLTGRNTDISIQGKALTHPLSLKTLMCS